MTSLPFNKVCGIEDFSHPDLVGVLRDVCDHKLAHFPDFPEGAQYRKDWEVAMSVRALREFGVLRSDATILGVGAGTEDTVFYLTRQVKQVFATDRYLASGNWEPNAPLSMLVDPEAVAPFVFDPRRLVTQHMDGRLLRYPDNMFDGVFSSGSIEHFGDLQDVASAAYEMGRVLAPGGTLALSTEFRISGPPGGAGWPGLTLIFSEENLRRFIVDASGLELVDELRAEVSDETMSTPRDLTRALDEHDARMAQGRNGHGPPEYTLWDFPHLVLAQLGYVITSVHLTLRKTERYPLVPNDWARPSPTLAAAINQNNRILVNDVSANLSSSAGAPPPHEPAPVPATLSLVERQTALDQGLQAMARGFDVLQATLVELTSQPVHIDRQLLEIDRHREEADLGLKQVAAAEELEQWRAPGSQEADPLDGSGASPASVPGGSRPSWVACTVSLAEGLQFQVMIDRDTGDPVTAALAEGVSVDQPRLSLMLQLVRPGDKVLDLGAHVGTYSLAAAAAGAHSLAIEASPENVALLRTSASRNGFQNVHVVHAAASDEPGTVEFVSNGPWGCVVPDDTTVAGTIKVPAITVGDLLSELGWWPLAFVKIDVEGSEIKAIRGMRELLSGDDAPPILYESNGFTLAFNGADPSQLIGELEELGYTSYLVEDGRLIRFRAGEMQPETLVDYLAIKRPPPGLEGWKIEPSMSFEERVAKLAADCRHTNEHVRMHIARVLSGADEAILSHPDLINALDSLTTDAVEEVRRAAGWWTDRRAPDASEG